MQTTGAVILAAGGSLRLGQPKQFLIHRGRSLIQRAAAAAGDCSPVVVVAGRDSGRTRLEFAGREVSVVENPQWERGIGGSIRAGVARAIGLSPSLQALFIMVCDQPFVTRDILAALHAILSREGKPAAACCYAGGFGVPALFSHTLFNDLLSLPDGSGAKMLLAKLGNNVATLAFPAGAIDIDTPADSTRWLDPPSIDTPSAIAECSMGLAVEV